MAKNKSFVRILLNEQKSLLTTPLESFLEDYNKVCDKYTKSSPVIFKKNGYYYVTVGRKNCKMVLQYMNAGQVEFYRKETGSSSSSLILLFLTREQMSALLDNNDNGYNIILC